MGTDTHPLVDAHIHVASADVDHYPRNPTGVGSDWWSRPADADELRGVLTGSGVERAVVVQAVGVYGYDCRYAASVTAASQGRLALVAAVDMAGKTVEDDFLDLWERHHPAGIRLFGVGAAGSAWLTDGTGASVWELAAGLGCTLAPTVFSDALPAIRTLMEGRPEVVVALDHCAFPDLGGPGAMVDVCAMAELPGLHLKVTSHNLDREEDPAAVLEPMVTAFGAARLCWGSDHPQHSSLTYPAMLGLARRAARNLTEEDRAAFVGGTALRLWW